MRSLIDRAFPPDSETRARLIQVDGLYAALDARLAAFAAAVPFRCPPGCGRCSASFEPDVLPLEALLTALFACAAGVRLDGCDTVPAGRCPLYREDTAAHCPVYPARPLVCRLFGFSALPDKRGALAYTPCEHMDGPGRGTRPIDSLGLPESSLPPSMTDFATQLTLIAPGEERARKPFRQALAEAVRKIGLYEGLRAKGENDDQGNRSEATISSVARWRPRNAVSGKRSSATI